MRKKGLEKKKIILGNKSLNELGAVGTCGEVGVKASGCSVFSHSGVGEILSLPKVTELTCTGEEVLRRRFWSSVSSP